MAFFSCLSLSQCFVRRKSRAESPAPAPFIPARPASPASSSSTTDSEWSDRTEARQPLDISPERPRTRPGRRSAGQTAELAPPAAGQGLRLRANAAVADGCRSVDSGPGTPVFAMSPEPCLSEVGARVLEQRMEQAKQFPLRGRARRRKVRPAREDRNDDGSTWAEKRERPGRPQAIKSTNYLGSDSSPETSRQRPGAPPAAAPALAADRHSHDERLSLQGSNASPTPARGRNLRRNTGFTAELTAW